MLGDVNREAAKEKLTGMMDLIGYPEQVLNSTWLNHRYGSDWLPGASAQQHLAQSQVWI
jgi:hypothetical protein